MDKGCVGLEVTSSNNALRPAFCLLFWRVYFHVPHVIRISATSLGHPLGHLISFVTSTINPGPHQVYHNIYKVMMLLTNLRNATLAFVMRLLLSTGAVAVDDTIVIYKLSKILHLRGHHQKNFITNSQLGVA